MAPTKVKPLTKAENKLYLQLQSRLYDTEAGAFPVPPKISISEAIKKTVASHTGDVTGIQATLDQRGNRYGDFTDHALIAQDLQSVMRSSVTKYSPIQDDNGYYNGWNNLSTVQRQALTVIADKIARILSGDPNYADNWHDIQGYAKLVEDRLPCNQHG